MSKFDYRAALEPVFAEIVELFEAMELKHGAGLYFSQSDQEKTITHMTEFMMGRDNPDGFSHATASASRACKARLAEMESND